MSTQDDNILHDRLRLGTGFAESERQWVLDHLAALGTRLRSYQPEQVEMEISVKERDTPQQSLTLECWLPQRVRLVATASSAELGTALNEVRSDLIRQIGDHKNRSEPRQNRNLRDTIRE